MVRTDPTLKMVSSLKASTQASFPPVFSARVSSPPASFATLRASTLVSSPLASFPKVFPPI